MVYYFVFYRVCVRFAAQGNELWRLLRVHAHVVWHAVFRDKTIDLCKERRRTKILSAKIPFGFGRNLANLWRLWQV